jgi:peptidoglycan/LPS O-acetylase OafA/YrhL
MQRRFFDEIVGLRIYLACWVALQHALQSAGYTKANGRLMTYALSGDVAVQLFMIISGFVITSLIRTKREDYLPYLIRRFFRLYPVYIVGLCAGFAVAGMWVGLAADAPWKALPHWPAYTRNIAALYQQETANFIPHALLHSVMLHGLIPEQVLPLASETFLPAGWSLSLEWQFYILAPLVIAAVMKLRTALIAAALAVGAYVLYRCGALGTYLVPSTIVASTLYFAIGIGCRFLVDRLMALTIPPIIPAAAFLAIAALFPWSLGIALWGAFYSYMLWSGRGSVDTKAFHAIFRNRPTLLLGEASYSVYLLHRPVQVVAGYLVQPQTQSGMALLMTASLLITFALSLITFKLIERPGELLGRRLAARFGKASAPEPLPVG